MKLSFKLAFKFLIKSPLQSILIILTLLAGIASLLFLTTLFTSLDKTLDEATKATLYHVSLQGKSNHTIKYNEELLQWIENHEDVESTIYFRGVQQTIFYNDVEIINYLYLSIDEEIFNYFKIKLVSGRFPESANEIIIPDALKEKHNLTLPITLNSHLAQYNINPEVTIVGTYDATNRLAGYRGNIGYISLINSPLNVVNFNSLRIILKDINKTDKFLLDLKSEFDENNFRIADIRETSTIYKLIKRVQTLVLVTIEVFIALAIFMISSSIINYSITSKLKQIGILKAIGYQHKHLVRTFFIQSFILALISSALGLLLTNGGLKFLRFIMRDANGNQRLVISVNETLYYISFGVVFLTIMLSTYNAVRKTKLISTINLLKE